MSNTIQVRAAVPNVQPDAPRAVGAGVVGGSRGVELTAPRAKKGTTDLSLLAQFGSKLLEPLIKKEQERAFIAGMGRAVQGETAAEIEAERPAWASAFGDSAATQGARAHEAVTDAAQLSRTISETLPQDRKLTPEQYTQELYKRVEARKTGDPVRDAAYMQTAMQYLPDALKAHQRARMAWEQTEAEASATQMTDHVMAAATAKLDGFRKDTTTFDEQAYDNTVASVMSLLTPVEGVNFDAQVKRFVNSAQKGMLNGQFGVMQMLRDEGLLDKMPPDAAEALINTERVSSVRLLPERVVEFAPEAMDAWAQIVMNRDLTPDALRAAADGINKTVATATGITAAPFITPNQIENKIIGDMKDDRSRAEAERERAIRKAERAQDRAISRAEARWEREQEEAAKNAQAAVLYSRVQSGVVDAAQVANKTIPGTSAKVEQMFLQDFLSGPQGPGQGPMAVAQYRAQTSVRYAGEHGNIPDVVRNRLAASARASNITADTALDLLTIDAIQGTSLAGRAFSPEVSKIASAVSAELRANPDLDLKSVLELSRARVRESEASATVPAGRAEALREAWQQDGRGVYGDFVGVLTRPWGDVSHVADEDARTKQFVGAAEASGLRDYGGVTFMQDRNQVEWTQLVNRPITREEAGEVLRAKADAVAEAWKLEPDQIKFVRVDQPGDTASRWMVTRADGGKPIVFGQDELLTIHDRIRAVPSANRAAEQRALNQPAP